MRRCKIEHMRRDDAATCSHIAHPSITATHPSNRVRRSDNNHVAQGIAPMLKSSTATMLNKSRSYSRPKRSSSHLHVHLPPVTLGLVLLQRLCSNEGI